MNISFSRTRFGTIVIKSYQKVALASTDEIQNKHDWVEASERNSEPVLVDESADEEDGQLSHLSSFLSSYQL